MSSLRFDVVFSTGSRNLSSVISNESINFHFRDLAAERHLSQGPKPEKRGLPIEKEKLRDRIKKWRAASRVSI